MSMIPFRDYDFRRLKIETVKDRKTTTVNNIFCHDIEVSSYFIVNGNVMSLNDILEIRDVEKIEKIFEKCETGGVPYIWQFSLDDDIVYGREYFDFRDFLKELSNYVGYKSYIYIHNIAYEYVFLREVLKDDINDVMFTENRKPLYFTAFDNLEFRCSYRLTNLSLEKWGESIGVQKRVGDLDYGVLRSPKTKIEEKELGYCEYDLRVMIAGLRKYRDQYGSIKNIPLTQTGEVRRPIKQINAKIYGQSARFAECMPKSPEEIAYQNAAFMGGITLSNITRTNKVLRGLISEDIASAYPTEIFRNKYPSCGFFRAPYYGEKSLSDGNHHIMLVTFKDLEAKYPIGVIPFSKRIAASGDIKTDGDGKDFTKNNGKIMFASSFSMYLTEKDYLAYKRLYVWRGDPEIHAHYIATSDYIPKSIIEFMLSLYQRKTTLKHADPDLYMKSKQMLNSIYGMMVSMPYHNEFFEDGYRPNFRRLKISEVQDALAEYQKKTYKNVVPYSWGVYVTASQRSRIINAIAHFCELGQDGKIVYIDTDSMKGFFDYHLEYDEKGKAKTVCDEQFFIDENIRILAECRSICKERGIPFDMYSPADDIGVKHPLGMWETDGYYHEFKTCGAKRYAYKESEKDKINITIAGVPKKCAGILHTVDDLREGLVFDIFNSHKNLVTYKDGDNPLVTLPDGYRVRNVCAVNIRPTSYKLTMPNEYKELIQRYAAYNK